MVDVGLKGRKYYKHKKDEVQCHTGDVIGTTRAITSPKTRREGLD